MDASGVSVIVVSYNTRDLTRRCLDSVAAHPPARPHELVVFDNASTDGSAEMVARDFPAATLLRSERNLGFGPAVNAAARSATGAYLVLLNPDAEVLPGAMDRLLAAAEGRPGYDIVGGSAVRGDGDIDASSCLGRPTVWGHLCFATGLSTAFPRSPLFASETLAGWDRRTARVVPAVSGCFVAFRRELFLELGGFDERYFMYGEDVDLCLRAAKRGRVTYYTPEAAVRHESGQASRSRADKLVLLLSGKVTLIERHWHPAVRPLGRWCLMTGVALRAFAGRASASRRPPDSDRSAWRTAWERRSMWVKGYGVRVGTGQGPSR